MDSNYFKSVLPFAASAGLKTDNLSGVIYGNYQGYNITITPIQGGKTFQLSFSVKRGVDMPSAAEMQQLARANKSLFLVSLDVEINPRFYRGIVKRAELQQKWRGECQAERL